MGYAAMGRDPCRRGFSRYELLFALALILMVASIALPAREFVQRWQRLEMARGDLRSIITSVQRYRAQYNTWPGTASAHAVGDIQFGRRAPNSEVLNVLRSVDGAGNRDHAMNSNRVVFLDVAAASPGFSGLNGRGEFVDPWGNAYRIVLDLDYDGVCEVSDSVYGRVQGEGVIAWSCGPDGKSDNEDDLQSWKWSASRRPLGASY